MPTKFKYYVKKMNNGKWYVLRPANAYLIKLRCEDGEYSTMQDAMQAMLDELKNRGITNYDQDDRV